MITPVLAVLAAVQPAPSAPVAPGPVAALEACREVAGDAARLACFDRTVAAFMAARAKKDVVVMDRAEVRKTKRSLFGFTLPSFNIFGGGGDKDDADNDEIKELEGKLASGRPVGVGFYQLTLQDGSAWETTERKNTLNPKEGDAIRIRKNAFGYRAHWKSIMVPVRRVR